MALKIMGCNDYTIREFGFWTSDTWKMCIHIQIEKLSEGVAKKVRTPIPYQNIAFIYPPQIWQRIDRNFIDQRHRPKEALVQ